MVTLFPGILNDTQYSVPRNACRLERKQNRIFKEQIKIHLFLTRYTFLNVALQLSIINTKNNKYRYQSQGVPDTAQTQRLQELPM